MPEHFRKLVDENILRTLEISTRKGAYSSFTNERWRQLEKKISIFFNSNYLVNDVIIIGSRKSLRIERKDIRCCGAFKKRLSSVPGKKRMRAKQEAA